MKKSENLNEIAKAMSAFQGQMKSAAKDSNNPFFQSRYSNLESVWDAMREPFSKNELSAVQDVFTTDNGVSITTTILHSSGQWMEFGPLEIPISKKDAQSVGSATTYGKRYALGAACGVVSGEDDDDGEKAMNRNGEKEKPKAKEKPRAQPILPTELSALMSISSDCSEDYMNKVYNHLKTLGFETFAQITQDIYPQVMNGMKKNAEWQKEKNV
jgi:hypothetical protein